EVYRPYGNAPASRHWRFDALCGAGHFRRVYAVWLVSRDLLRDEKVRAAIARRSAVCPRAVYLLARATVPTRIHSMRRPAPAKRSFGAKAARTVILHRCTPATS